MHDLLLSHDIGVSSIGWAVWKTDTENPTLLATGDVDFPTDDCLASKRRQLCHLRRTIRSRKLCIEQLGKLFVHLNLLTPDELAVNRAKAGDFRHHPWFLAARVLAAKSPEQRQQALLSWPQMWDVLRWYAHNRGYFVSWGSDHEGDTDDTRKVEAADAMMEEHGVSTMAESFAAAYGVGDLFNPSLGARGKFVGEPFKGKRPNGKKGNVNETPSFDRKRVLIPELPWNSSTVLKRKEARRLANCGNVNVRTAQPMAARPKALHSTWSCSANSGFSLLCQDSRLVRRVTSRIPNICLEREGFTRITSGARFGKNICNYHPTRKRTMLSHRASLRRPLT